MATSFVVYGQHLITDDGLVLEGVHHSSQCESWYCTIHCPSEHHMRSWPLAWREDRGIWERMCPCGNPHPDPDQHPSALIHAFCDGCCIRPV
jgi:hypothetical protein